MYCVNGIYQLECIANLAFSTLGRCRIYNRYLFCHTAEFANCDCAKKVLVFQAAACARLSVIGKTTTLNQ